MNGTCLIAIRHNYTYMIYDARSPHNSSKIFNFFPPILDFNLEHQPRVQTSNLNLEHHTSTLLKNVLIKLYKKSRRNHFEMQSGQKYFFNFFEKKIRSSFFSIGKILKSFSSIGREGGSNFFLLKYFSSKKSIP